jgi:DNA-binding FadR family transcriptional regulator
VPRPLKPAPRTRVADAVFEQLAAAIVGGDYPAGETLPSERTLAEELQASRVLVREAIHRLAEIGLVRVRQGAATEVLSVEDATDVRVLELVYRLGDRLSPRYEVYVIERQYMNGVALLELAAKNATLDEKRAIERWVEERAPSSADRFLDFEQGFWIEVAEAAGNPILEAELRWWYGLVGERMPRPQSVASTPLPFRIAFHRELARRLATGEDAVAYYLSIVRPILDGLRERHR